MSTFLNQGNGGEESTSQGEQSTEGQQFEQQAGGANEQQEKPSAFLTVGDRVFKTQEDAINHVSHAQNYISKLEKDFESATQLIDRQNQLLEKSSKVDELMDAVANRQNSSGNAEETPQLSKEEVIADALKAFEQHRNEQTRAQQLEQNWNNVTSTLTQLYGDKTDEVVQKVAGENNLTVQEAADMAKRHPKVFLKMFDADKPRSSAQPTRSSLNSENIGEQPVQYKSKSFMKMSMKERANRVQQMLQELD